MRLQNVHIQELNKGALREQAIKLLARREHSRYELQRKLTAKGWNAKEVTEILDGLAAERLQDDERFTSAYIRYRAAAGYGPRRIIAELSERGIHEIPDTLADETSEEWLEALAQAWQKKFASKKPVDLKTRAKQTRFLIYRGFNPEHVNRFLTKKA